MVTQYALQTHDIGQILSGERIYTEDKLTQVSSAITNFVAKNSDNKAAVIPTLTLVAPGYLVNAFLVFLSAMAQRHPRTSSPALTPSLLRSMTPRHKAALT